MSLLDTIREDVINGKVALAQTHVEQALAAGESPAAILNDALISAMTEVGRRFETEEYYVPEMLLSARAMKAGLALIKPKLASMDAKPIGRVVLGTIKGDLHDIGKNLVAVMMEGAGFQVIDLGVDVPPQKFVEAVQKGAQIVGLSALLTTTMPMMKGTIDALVAAGVRDRAIVMIGGAPITQEYADKIGADIYAPDASVAARKARERVLRAA